MIVCEHQGILNRKGQYLLSYAFGRELLANAMGCISRIFSATTWLVNTHAGVTKGKSAHCGVIDIFQQTEASGSGVQPTWRLQVD